MTAPGVAITGMACLFPGAPDVAAFWRNILGKVDAVSDPPPEAFDPGVYHDPDFADEDRTYTKRGGYLGELASFDALAHGIPPVAVGGEPDQWLALQVAHDALADAGALDLPEDVRARTEIVLGKGTYLNGGNAIAVQRGLVIGQTIDLLRRLHPEHTEAELEELRREMQRSLPPLTPDTVPGLIPNIIVGRIANRLDLMGPAYTVDAACASSLVAVGHAVRDLVAGDCDLALAGGSQVWIPVATMNLFCRLGALSRRERLRPFGKGSDGTLLGEGIGMIVLKRLEDARRDGDRVYAVLRGVGVASDGRAMGVMAPRVEGEELALRRAYADTGIDPRTVGLIEAHGTGTPVGDAAEVEALRRVFGERDGEAPRCALGTVKSMISHPIPAAGVAGIIKTALALHHRVLPPTLCDEPNPDLGLERTPFYLNTEPRPWIHGGAEPRRAGVDAFGFGGINAHAIVEEADAAGPAGRTHQPPWDSELCVLEAATPEALADAADELAAALESGGDLALADLAFTLSRQVGRTEEPLRLAIVATSIDDLRAKLAQAAPKLRDPKTRRLKVASGIHHVREPLGRDGKVVLVFPGEGAQYPNMLADLARRFDEVRAVFDRVDRLYADHPRGDLLSDWVFPPPLASEAERRRAEERLMQLDIAVESVLTANGAMHALLERLLPRVDAVLGHSTGEHSAALVTGVLDVDTDAGLVAFSQGLYRAYAGAAERHEMAGAVLLALGTDAQTALDLATRAGGELHLAMDNCPHQAVLVGEPEAAGRARALAREQGIVCEELPYDRAVHTPLFAPFAEDLRAVFAGLPVGRAHTALWSCTTAAPYPDDPEAIRALLVEHWTSPVRFRETIEALYDDGARVFVECGPRGNMTAFVEDVLRGRPALAVAADSPRRSGTTQLNHLVAQLLVHGVDVDVAHLFAGREVREVDWRAGTPPPAQRPRVPLHTSWPMIRLAPEAIERLRGSNGHRAGTDGNGNGAVPAPETAVDTRTPGVPSSTGAPAPETAVDSRTPGVPSSTAMPADDDELALAVEDHLRTMERFLETGQEVMQAYLAGAGAAPAVAPRLPLLGDVVALEPGAELVARRRVDPDADPALRDHALGRTVARTDPELRGLPLMPLALSLEVLAEAAVALLGHGEVTGLRDVRAHRWIAFPRPLELEVTARRLVPADGAERVRVELRDGIEEGPAVEGTVLIADAYADPPPPIAVDLDGVRPGERPAGRLYGEVMFHGPAWQAVDVLAGVAPAAAVARLRVLPGDAGHLLDPVVLDAAGQVVGFWAAEQLDRGRVVFPFRLAALDVFGPRRPEGETLACAAAIALEGRSLTRSDIDVLDAQARTWMRLRGWEDRRFDVPARFAPLTLAGELAPLSEPWDGPAAALGNARAAARRFDARLGADRALWLPAWAWRVLGRAERERFLALQRPDDRRLEWLGARTAAKEAVLALLPDDDLLPADVAIEADERGRPYARIAGRAEVPAISLAHAHGRCAALAAFVGEGGGVGIDLEPLRELPDGFAEAALGAAERRLLAALPGDEWLLRCWCAKEAAGKAVGTGIDVGERRPAIAGIDAERGDVDVLVGDRRLRVATRREDDLIVATAQWPDLEGGRA